MWKLPFHWIEQHKHSQELQIKNFSEPKQSWSESKRKNISSWRSRIIFWGQLLRGLVYHNTLENSYLGGTFWMGSTLKVSWFYSFVFTVSCKYMYNKVRILLSSNFVFSSINRPTSHTFDEWKRRLEAFIRNCITYIWNTQAFWKQNKDLEHWRLYLWICFTWQ